MCASCGITTHFADDGPPTAATTKFAALRLPDLRYYLAGFTVISHWMPHLLLSVWFGALADRYDCRRVIQAAQVLFITASATWGLLFFSGTLTVWWAVALTGASLGVHWTLGFCAGLLCLCTVGLYLYTARRTAMG